MDNRIILVAVGVFAFVCALVLGDKVATGDYRTIAIYVVVFFSILYLVKLYQYSLVIIIFLAMSGISVQLPIGAVSSRHMALGLFCLTAGYELFRRSPDRLQIRTWKLGLPYYIFSILMIVCLYLFQIASPVNPHEFSAKQTFKALVETMGPFLILMFWCLKSDAYVFRMASMRPILLVLSLLLSLHIGFRTYLMGIGAIEFGEAAMEADEVTASFRLPGGIAVSRYALRGIGPLAVVIAAFVALSPQSKSHKSSQSLLTWFFAWFVGIFPFWYRWTRPMAWTVVAMGLIGALLSSGRASVLLSVLGLFVALAYYRRFVPILLAGAVTVLTIALLNVFSTVVNEQLPSSVSRSVSLVIFTEKTGAGAKSITSSTNWRYELAELAFDEWTSDVGSFVRGRGVYTYTHLDANAAALQGGYEAQMMSSLKTGNAHVKWLVLALKFGLISIVLWYILHTYIGLRSLSIARKNNYKSINPLFAACTYILCISFFGSLMSSGGMGLVPMLLILAATRQMSADELMAQQSSEREEIELEQE